MITNERKQKIKEELMDVISKATHLYSFKFNLEEKSYIYKILYTINLETKKSDGALNEKV